MGAFGLIIASAVASWLAGRAHLRATQAKKLDNALGLPVGTVETAANDATERAAELAGQAVGRSVDKGAK